MSTYDLTTTHHTTLQAVGEIANYHASKHVLSDYQKKLTANTKRRQHDDFLVFSRYLACAGITLDAAQLMNDVASWHGVTEGLIKGFIRWMETEGYAIGSINVRLATVKRYCSLAAETYVLDASTAALISKVRSYSHKDGRNLDKERALSRVGAKKAEPVSISKDQASQLKQGQPDTPQGHRDALLMCLLLDHGLRCGEIAGLKASCVNLVDETLTFYREKVDKVQTHELTKDTRIALRKYLADVQLSPDDSLLLGSRKGGTLQGRMSERAITARMCELGTRIDVQGLSAHDGRHAWATFAVKAGTDIKALQVAGGWQSTSMPLRYADAGVIANAGVKLD